MTEWPLRKIGDLGRVVTGRTPSSSRPECFSGQFPFITPTDMDGRRTMSCTERTISDEGARLLKSTLIPQNSIAVSCIGWQLGNVVITDKSSFTNQQINTIIPHDTVDHNYLYYALTTKRELLKRFGSMGVRTPIVNKSTFSSIEVEVPPLPTQRSIASILSAYDDLIENNTRRITILEEMARRLYEEWFVQFRFPGHEESSLKETEIGPVPSHWPLVRLDQAVLFNPKTKVSIEGEKLFVPMAALSESNMLIGPLEVKSGNNGAKFQNGDTLVARISPCLENGKIGFVDVLPPHQPTASGSTEFIVMRSKILCPEMVYLIARSDRFRDVAIKSMSGATGRQRVRTESLEELSIVQPDDDTLNKFREVVAPGFKQVTVLARQNANLRAQRDLLLPKLISGEIDVSEVQAPTEATAA